MRRGNRRSPGRRANAASGSNRRSTRHGRSGTGALGALAGHTVRSPSGFCLPVQRLANGAVVARRGCRSPASPFQLAFEAAATVRAHAFEALGDLEGRLRRTGGPPASHGGRRAPPVGPRAQRGGVAAGGRGHVRQELDWGEPNEVWVIGDTPLDVQCARAIGVRVLAVATGMFSRDEIAVGEPDQLLEDLGDTDRVVPILVE